MKLTNTNSSILQSIRQPTQLGEQDSLAFIYPFIIDKNLDKQYGRVLRDFFTCQFVAQIKTSNILNITVKATNSGSTNQNLNQLENAAERTAQSDTLGLLTSQIHQPGPGLINNMYQDQQKYEYDNKLNKFREFIFDQIKHDPKYADLNILVSDITVENLLDIPLILGTKSSTINSLPLFWILLAATGQYRDKSLDEDGKTKSIRMDRSESFQYIKRFIRNINVLNYEKILHTSSVVPSQTSKNRIDSLLSSIDDELDRAIRTFERVTNESYYAEDVGISQHQALSITNILQSNLTTQRNINSKALTLFTSLISNYIVPIVHSVTASVVSIDEINISNRVSKLIDSLLLSTAEQYNTLNNQITQGLQQENVEQTGNMLDQFNGMCKNNASISVTKILLELSNSRFKITGTKESFIDFVESIMKISNQLNAHKSNLETQLVELANESNFTKEQLKRFGNSDVGLMSGLARLIEGNRVVKMNQTDGIIVRIFQTYFQEDLNVVNNTADPYYRADQSALMTDDPNNRLRQMIGGSHKENIVFINNIITALTNITVFFAYYTFFSYLCEFIQEIKATVESQRKDALDFPNYCLVVNKSVIESIYSSLAAYNYSKDKSRNTPEIQSKYSKTDPFKPVESKEPLVKNRFKPTEYLNLHDTRKPFTTSDTSNIYPSFKVNETEIMNMIRTLNNKLFIPNIIVVDEKTNTIYYKWMYSGGQIGKLTLSTVQNYVTHQKQALCVI